MLPKRKPLILAKLHLCTSKTLPLAKTLVSQHGESIDVPSILEKSTQRFGTLIFLSKSLLVPPLVSESPPPGANYLSRKVAGTKTNTTALYMYFWLWGFKWCTGLFVLPATH